MNIKSPLARRLKEARIAANLSQKQLGIAAGIDEFSASARMNQYEVGKHIPDFNTLSKIAKVLQVPTAYFYADNDELAKLIKLYAGLTKADRQRALLAVENLQGK